MVHTLVSVFGAEAAPVPRWAPLDTSPSNQSVTLILQAVNKEYVLDHSCQLTPRTSARELYQQALTIYRSDILLQLQYNKANEKYVIYPGDQTLQDMGMSDNDVVQVNWVFTNPPFSLFSFCLSSPLILGKDDISPWVRCKLNQTDLVPHWTPQTHHQFPKCVRDSVVR